MAVLWSRCGGCLRPPCQVFQCAWIVLHFEKSRSSGLAAGSPAFARPSGGADTSDGRRNRRARPGCPVQGAASQGRSPLCRVTPQNPGLRRRRGGAHGLICPRPGSQGGAARERFSRSMVHEQAFLSQTVRAGGAGGGGLSRTEAPGALRTCGGRVRTTRTFSLAPLGPPYGFATLQTPLSNLCLNSFEFTAMMGPNYFPLNNGRVQKASWRLEKEASTSF